MPELNVPIIRLEVEGLKRTMLLALTEHAALMDKSTQQAVEDFCSDSHIDAIVRREAQLQLNAALREEVRQFFLSNGPGRAAVRQAVIEALEQRYPNNLDCEGRPSG
jgi:hypothetical protein